MKYYTFSLVNNRLLVYVADGYKNVPSISQPLPTDIINLDQAISWAQSNLLGPIPKVRTITSDKIRIKNDGVDSLTLTFEDKYETITSTNVNVNGTVTVVPLTQGIGQLELTSVNVGNITIFSEELPEVVLTVEVTNE